MSISKYIVSVAYIGDLSIQLLKEEFGMSHDIALKVSNENVLPHFYRLKDTCYLVAETPYVDKVYRNSYYHYFSSKHKKYGRDCIRISIFENEITEEDFFDRARVEDIKKRYRGFVVLRPIEPYVIGRNVISPRALKDNGFLSCATQIQTTVNGVKFSVEGFPHSSQDTETKSCAETTLWAMMEYFGNKYSDYQPVLPFKIIQVLKEISTERQVPSKGLSMQQISFALRQFGFGTKIYSENSYQGEFRKLLRIYLESGIPVICGIDNRHIIGGNIGHAVICVGREQISDNDIDNLPVSTVLNQSLSTAIAAKGYALYDWSDNNKNLIFVDDNFPVYQRASFDNPTSHYPTLWHNCTIKHFIAPLYPKIYLEAFQAKNFVLKFLMQGSVPLINGTEVLIRFFLSSSRSFKDSVSFKQGFHSDLRNIILELPMPKFIWIAEISNKTLMKQRKANGIIILDATEADVSNHKPLTLAVYQNHFITLKPDGDLENIPFNSSTEFSTYKKNLKNL